MQRSERPSAIQTLSWARPGPIPGPRWSRPDSPCALFYSVSDPSRSRGGAHPGPSWSHPAPERSLQDRAWTGRNRLLGHFRNGPPYSSNCRVSRGALRKGQNIGPQLEHRHIRNITFLIQKHFKTVTVTIILKKIKSHDFQDGNWEPMETKG